MPTAYRAEFRPDVIDVARKGGAPLAQTAKDFGLSLMKSSLAVAALENALRARRPAGTVVRSDRGSQFRSRRFVESLWHHGLTGSMGREGACADNAAMESFFSLLQERPGPSAVGRPAGTPDGLHDLDREDLPPPATAKTAGKTHAHRI